MSKSYFAVISLAAILSLSLFAHAFAADDDNKNTDQLGPH
jgi:hypothetical protein